MALRAVVGALISLLLAGCAIPQAGPTAMQLEGSREQGPDVYLVRVSAPVVSALSRYQEPEFPTSLRAENYAPSVALRPGDTIAVSVFETGTTPLFGAAAKAAPPPGAPADASSQASTLPPQTIEQDGQILVPFVGRVRVAGKTPSQAAEEIAHRLSRQTVTPEVLVVGNFSGNVVSVGGEVNKAGAVPLTLKGERLLDTIALAGGPKYPAHQTDVRVIRRNVTANIPLQSVIANPMNNIVMQPGDTVVLVKNPRTFVVLGAAAKVAQYEMQSEKVTLAEGIAQGGGTLDAIGNLSAVYLLRTEPASMVESVRAADQAAVDTTYVRGSLADGTPTRTMYRIDLTSAGGYFFAQNIALRDKDIVLMANAEAAQWQKILTILRGITGLYFDVTARGVGWFLQN